MNAVHASTTRFRIGMLVVVVLALLPLPAPAQPMDPNMSMSMPMPAKHSAPAKKPARTKTAKPPATSAHTVDHAAMDMGMTMPMEPTAPTDQSVATHAAMTHTNMPMPPDRPRQPIPVPTAADRTAAFPQVTAHAMHDNDVQSFVLFDRLETWNANRRTGFEWEGSGWIGTDLNRVWLRSEGTHIGSRTEDADLEVLYGRSVAAWWDVVVGVRHDFKPGASQDFAAIGVIGMAPDKFEVKATAYIGRSGQTSARLESEYELLLTNRLILQPLVEVNLFGRNDPQRGIGSGLGTLEAGLRLRYEVTRQFAPYIGIVSERAFGRTTDFRRDAGETVGDTHFVAGLRFWF